MDRFEPVGIEADIFWTCAAKVAATTAHAGSLSRSRGDLAVALAARRLADYLYEYDLDRIGEVRNLLNNLDSAFERAIHRGVEVLDRVLSPPRRDEAGKLLTQAQLTFFVLQIKMPNSSSSTE